MEVILKQEKIGGIETLVSADNYGSFNVYVHDDKHAVGDTLDWEAKREMTRLADGKTLSDALDRAKTAAAKRRVRVKVPFISQVGEHGIATGIHAGTGAVLANIGGVSGVQLSASTETNVFPGDTDQYIVEEYISEQNRKTDAERRLQQMQREHMIRLRDVVEETIDAQLAAAPIDVDAIEAERAAAGPVSDPA